MSVKVDLDRLADTLVEYSFAYLVTVGDDFRAHTVAVTPVLRNGEFTIDPLGSTTRRNACAHDAVTVVWPPREPTGYSLIVDGTAAVTEDGLRLTPARAVLHRSPEGRHDCVSLKG